MLPTSSDVAVIARGLSKRYRLRESQTTALDAVGTWLRRPLARRPAIDFWALRGATFEIRQGEVLGLIGRNGAGKSTLLKLLSRITTPTSGQARIHGRVGSLLEVGTGFHPELTGRENVFLNGTLLGMRRRRIEQVFDAIVDFAQVSQFLDVPVKRYSSGMYVRLAFAVAAHLDVDVLLIDEVLAVGDLEFQRRSLGKMDEVARQGRTVVFVSHSMESVARLCETAILLDGGRIECAGAASDVIAAYVKRSASETPRAMSLAAEPVGDETAQVLGVWLTQGPEPLGAPADIRLPLIVHIAYRSQAARGEHPLVSVVVRNGSGMDLFASNNRLASSAAGRSEPGIAYEAVCTIPGNYLAEGSHLITVLLHDALTVHARLDDAIGFEVRDPGGPETVRGNYSGDWVGVVRPMLSWKINQIEPPPEEHA